MRTDGGIALLDPALIGQSKRNSRKADDCGSEAETPTDEPSFTQLVRTIRRRGLLEPIGVRPLPKVDERGHTHELVFGSRRLRAFKIAKPGEKIPCLIRENRGDYEALLDNLVENVHRRRIRPWMQAETFCELRELRPDVTVAAIAQEAGVTEYYCSTLIRIRKKLRPDLWELYKRWGETMRVGYHDMVELARLSHDEQLVKWNQLVDAKGKVGGGKVRGPQRRPGERKLARYLDVALAGELGGKSQQFQRGLVYALRVALGERRWGFGEGRQNSRRG